MTVNIDNPVFNVKGEGEKGTMDKIVELETHLIKQHKDNKEEDQDMLNAIHDAYYDVIGEAPTDEQVKNLAKDIQNDTEVKFMVSMWGWNDTEVEYKIYSWIRDNVE